MNRLMIKFNFNDFLIHNNLSPADLAGELNVPRNSISLMISRGTIKPSFIKVLKRKFKNVNVYLNETSLNRETKSKRIKQ